MESALFSPQAKAASGCSRGPIRAAFLTVMPSPYTEDLFAAMAADGRIRPRVYYLEMSAPDTHWGQRSLPEYCEVLPGRWFRCLGGRVHVNPGAVRRIAASRPDVVVVGGYAGLTNQALMWWLRVRRRPWIFWGETPGMRRLGRFAGALRRLAMLPAVRWPDGIAAIGSRAANSYRQLAARRCPVANIPYCCDVQPFLAISRNGQLRPRAPTRFLYCGQLIARKGVDVLMRAFLRVAGELGGVRLTLVGDGPLRRQLEAMVPEEHGPRVRFAGFQQVAQLPPFFADADVFVLPSRHDGWGVVINQAIAAGLPVIASDAVGAAEDLVDNGVNGRLVPAGDVAALAQAIRTLASDPVTIRAFGLRSRQLASKCTPETSVEKWHEFCLNLAQCGATASQFLP